MLLGALLGLAIACLLQWCLRRLRNLGDDDVEMVALFCNPQLPRRIGLGPLKFGQDLKFLIRIFPRGQLYVEPAASLYTTRRALVQHRPRLLMFSGHTGTAAAFRDSQSRRSTAIPNGGSHLLFETPDGHLDNVATTPLVVALLRTLARGGGGQQSILELASDKRAADAVETHLQAQQESALQMQHCDRAWMQRAAAERAEAAAADVWSGGSWSEHVLRGGGSSPTLRPVAAALLTAPKAHAALSRLQCVVLNACTSLEIAKEILRALPHICVGNQPRRAPQSMAAASPGSLALPLI